MPVQFYSAGESSVQLFHDRLRPLGLLGDRAGLGVARTIRVLALLRFLDHLRLLSLLVNASRQLAVLCDAPQLGHMLGNAMTVPVVAAVIDAALHCKNVAFWEDCLTGPTDLIHRDADERSELDLLDVALATLTTPSLR